MPNTEATWGIEIGRCALKALRCESGQHGLVATDFDFVEYPTALTQPEAANLLIGEAVAGFVSRHGLRGERVALALPGLVGLIRTLVLPPVQPSLVAMVVALQARQQIPFPLAEVAWDYHVWSPASPDASASAAEVLLAAVKRDVVHDVLRPLLEAGVDVEFVQLAPLALANYAILDQLSPPPDDQEHPPRPAPDPLLILALGTEFSEFVVTNGHCLWHRTIPLGGNHFTRAISSELQLAFDQAEQLKRTAAQSDAPRAIYKAIQPVLRGLASDVRLSLERFALTYPSQRVVRGICMGNCFKLSGLRRYLAEKVGISLQRVERFACLAGSEIIESPAFAENVLSLGTCLGLCAQGLRAGTIRTNLLPSELRPGRLNKLVLAGAARRQAAKEHRAERKDSGRFPFDVAVVCALIALNLGLLLWTVSRQPPKPPAVGEMARFTGTLRLVVGHEGELHLAGDGFEAVSGSELGRALSGYRWAASGDGADDVIVIGVCLDDQQARFRLLPGVPLVELRSIEKAADPSSRVEVGRTHPSLAGRQPETDDTLWWLARAVPAADTPCSFVAVVRHIYPDRLVVVPPAQTEWQAYAVLRGNAPRSLSQGHLVHVSGTVAPDAAPGRLVVLTSEIRLLSAAAPDGTPNAAGGAQGARCWQ